MNNAGDIQVKYSYDIHILTKMEIHFIVISNEYLENMCVFLL